MAWKNVMVTCWMVFFIIGCFLWSPHLFAVEAEKAKAGKTKKPFAVIQTKLCRPMEPMVHLAACWKHPGISVSTSII